MKRLLIILFFSIVLSQEGNSAYLRLELENAIKDINARQFDSAISRIENTNFSDSEYLNHSLILKMKALRGINAIDQSLFVAKQINKNDLNANLQTIYSLELGDLFSEMGLFDESFEHYLSTRKSNIDTKANKRINQRLNQLLKMDLSEKNLSSLQLLETDLINLNILKLAHAFLLARNQSENWKNVFSSVDYSMLSREFRSSYNYLKKNVPYDNYSIAKIGVVLPLSGDNSEYAQAFLS
ncbi:MAG: hypothetical protein VX826_00845, partial [Candidatus Neomarinimicrobiota bacterium]|nr:hypothetical protein [Candidatus Neomarinimicrobiota bacterium]